MAFQVSEEKSGFTEITKYFASKNDDYTMLIRYENTDDQDEEQYVLESKDSTSLLKSLQFFLATYEFSSKTKVSDESPILFILGGDFFLEIRVIHRNKESEAETVRKLSEYLKCKFQSI